MGAGKKELQGVKFRSNFFTRECMHMHAPVFVSTHTNSAIMKHCKIILRWLSSPFLSVVIEKCSSPLPVFVPVNQRTHFKRDIR